jgi:hypothetical protein
VSTINSDEHSAERYVRSEPEQPLALEHRDEPGAYFVPTGNRPGNKGGDVKRAGASARTSEHDRAFIRPTGPDGSLPRNGGRDSRVGCPVDYPRRSSHMRMTHT